MPFTDSIKMVDVIIAEKELLTATPSDVASGVKFIGKSQNIETGSIPINPTRTDITISNGEIFNIPYGINPVSYNIIASNLEDSTVADATPSDILSPKTAWVNGEKITGIIDTIQPENIELESGVTYTIEAGYHNGSGTVHAKSLFSQTKASIVPEDIVIGSNCWANGEFIEGTMPKNDSKTVTLSNGGEYIIPKGYHSGTGRVVASGLSGETPGTATPNTLVEGYTAWVNGQQITGIMPNNPDEEIILPMNGTYTIPNGYHTGFGRITQNVQSKPGQTVGPTKDAQILPLSGYYMEGDIIISGVDALNYLRPNSSPLDSTGISIVDYNLNVTNGTSVISISVDNWHDNNTMNVYNITGTIEDINGNSVQINSMIIIDWMVKSPIVTKISDNVTCTIELEDGTNSQIITISGINSGIITLIEKFSSREFGITSE